jgi:hypothetical protein
MVDPLKNVLSGYRVWQDLDPAGEIIPRQPPFFQNATPPPSPMSYTPFHPIPFGFYLTNSYTFTKKHLANTLKY